MKTTEKESLYVGFDIGSKAVHYSVIDSNGKLVYSPKPIEHLAKPNEALKTALEDITQKFGRERIRNTAFTGSGAEYIRSAIPNATYEFDSVTIPKGAKIMAPGADTVLYMGAKDAYYFNIAQIEGEHIISEVKSSSKCGGGSGTLVEKQCRRLLEEEVRHNKDTDVFQEAYKRALRSTKPSKFLARCGIVMQSDLIHLQNEGVSKEDNIAGLFQAVADNYVVDVIGKKKVTGNSAIATGGVMTNQIIIQRLEKTLGLKIQRPENYLNIGAIGAAYKGLEDNNNVVLEPEQIEKISTRSSERRFAPKLSLENVLENSEELEDKIKTGTKVVMGIDGGSTTTKGALIDLETGVLLDKLYVATHGDPVGSLKRVIKYLSRHSEDVEVMGVATTGSARQLYHRILVDQEKLKKLSKKSIEVVDKVTDEITCHALGIKYHDSGVQVIYEIGGQDMKFTEFNTDGTVKEAKMNFSCQAGGGQTLENMANIIGLDVKSSLQEQALKAERIPLIDSTCGVFMEMDVNRLISEGFSREEIAAAIVFGTAESYYNKFVGGSSKTKGKKSSAQGGPALGKAFLAALSQVSGDKINAYPHREMFGAWGAALDIRNRILELQDSEKPFETTFRGWNETDIDFSKERTTCKEYCKTENKNNCGVRDCELENYFIGSDKIITGGFCPTGNSEASRIQKKNYVAEFHKVLDKHFEKEGILFENLNSREKDTIGIRRCTSTIGEKGIWSATLLNRLGFTPVITPVSNHEIARRGIDNSRPEFCIARKLSTGHGLIIKENPLIEFSYNPSMIHHVQPGKIPLKYCVYTESEGYLLQEEIALDKRKTLNPIMEFGNEDSLIENIQKELGKVGKKTTRRRISQAISAANKAEEEFRQEVASRGEEFIKKINGEVAYVGIGRDYVILDPEASSNSGEMFSKTRGLNYIPQTFLMKRFEEIPIEDIAPDEYWFESRDILKAQRGVANTLGLYSIRMTNFGCGPDSIKLKQEKNIQQKANKPMLILSTDGHTSNAQFVTRTEAHERVVMKNFQNEKRKTK